MKKTIATVYLCAIVNLLGNAIVVGLIWFGWGMELFEDKLGLILWGLFLNSVALVFGLIMIAISRIIERKIIKKYQKIEVKEDKLARSFLEEWLKRNLEILSRKEMKDLMVTWLMIIEQLSEYVDKLGGKRPYLLRDIKSELESLPPRSDKD